MMGMHKISLTGDLGSGKSAVSKILSDKLNYRIVSTGSIQRDIAVKYNMSTLELNEYTKTHPEIDDEIDGTVTKLAETDENLIFDSRLAWHFAPHSFKVYLLVDSFVAAERIFNDHRTGEGYETVLEAREKILARRKSELERFKTYYHIDYADLRNFDLVIETTLATPEEVTHTILEAFAKWQQNNPFPRFHLSPKSLYPTRLVCCSLDKDLADVKVLHFERDFLIIQGHQPISKAIAQNLHLIPVECAFEGYDDFLKTLRIQMLKQWEDLNFIRFRRYPEYYLGL